MVTGRFELSEYYVDGKRRFGASKTDCQGQQREREIESQLTASLISEFRRRQTEIKFNCKRANRLSILICSYAKDDFSRLFTTVCTTNSLCVLNSVVCTGWTGAEQYRGESSAIQSLNCNRPLKYPLDFGSLESKAQYLFGPSFNCWLQPLIPKILSTLKKNLQETL